MGYVFDGYTVNGSVISDNTFNISSDATVAATYTDMFGMADGKHFHNGSEVFAPGIVTDMDKLNGKSVCSADDPQEKLLNS